MIAAFDLDGTLLKNNSSFSFCRFLCQEGVLSRRDLLFCTIVYARHRYLNLSLKDLHHLVFTRLFYGKTVSSLAPYVAEFVHRHIPKYLYFPLIERLHKLQQDNVECVIFSNSPDFLVRAIAQKLCINKVFATEYKTNAKGELIGLERLMDGPCKAACVAQFSSYSVIAFSDSHLDLSFLRQAKTAVAVNPKRKLKKIAKLEGWEIV